MGEKVALEQAKVEFNKFCEAWYIDNEIDTMKDEDKDSFLRCERDILRYVRDGYAVISEDGTQITLNLRKEVLGKQEVVFSIPQGDAFLNMDKFKERETIHKFNAFIAGSAGLAPIAIAKMNGIDVRFSQRVFSLFLG